MKNYKDFIVDSNKIKRIYRTVNGFIIQLIKVLDDGKEIIQKEQIKGTIAEENLVDKKKGEDNGLADDGRSGSSVGVRRRGRPKGIRS